MSEQEGNGDGKAIETYLGYTLNSSSDGENTLVYARDDLADAGLDAGLVTEIGNIFASLSDDDAGVLGADKSSESEGVLTSRRRRPRLVWGGCEIRCGEEEKVAI